MKLSLQENKDGVWHWQQHWKNVRLLGSLRAKSKLEAILRGDDSTGVLRCMTDALDKAVGGDRRAMGSSFECNVTRGRERQSWTPPEMDVMKCMFGSLPLIRFPWGYGSSDFLSINFCIFFPLNFLALLGFFAALYTSCYISDFLTSW